MAATTSEKWGDLRIALGPRVRIGELLAPHTTFRIGGPADLYVRADSVEQLATFVVAGRQAGAPVLVLGRGSNILVADSGWPGLVIENRAERFEVIEENQHATLYAESGAPLPLVAGRMARLGWRGLEWAVGIPGSVGAAVAGNAGAHGGCTADILQSGTLLNESGEIQEFANSDCAFAYRSSRFKRNGGREIVLSAKFLLDRDEPRNCLARTSAYSEHRRRTQPTEPSVGSMFKNPPGDYAGRLIEAAGLKGTRAGQVEVSLVHANFFVNLGGATAMQVLELVKIASSRVREMFGAELELEIELIGEI